MLYRGQVTLSVDQARRSTKYKYLVVKKGTLFWEDLPQLASFNFNGIFNRVLKIPEQYVSPGGKLSIIMTLSFEPEPRHFRVNFLTELQAIRA